MTTQVHGRQIKDLTVPVAKIEATGTRDATTFLRGDGVFAIPSGGGGTMTVQDEGATQSTLVTTLNFTGAGVTASGAGATATINIPGGGGGSSTPYEMLRQTMFLPF